MKSTHLQHRGKHSLLTQLPCGTTSRYRLCGRDVMSTWPFCFSKEFFQNSHGDWNTSQSSSKEKCWALFSSNPSFLSKIKFNVPLLVVPKILSPVGFFCLFFAVVNFRLSCWSISGFYSGQFQIIALVPPAWDCTQPFEIDCCKSMKLMISAGNKCFEKQQQTLQGI